MVISNQRGGIIGPGTIGKILKFATNTSAGDSLLSESGSTITVNGNLTATQGDLPSMARVAGGLIGGVQFGTTSGSRAESTMTGQEIGTGDFSIVATFRVPSSNPVTYPFYPVTLVETAGVNAIGVSIRTDGSIQFVTWKASVVTFTSIDATFVSKFSGQNVTLVITRSGTTLTASVNGATPSSYTDANANVSYTVAARFLVGGDGALNNHLAPIISARLFNRALSAADVARLSLYGVDAADEWGTMVPTYTQNTSAGVDGWGGSLASVAGNIDGIGTPSTDDTLRITVDGTAGLHNANRTTATPIGKRYRLTASILVPTANAAVDGYQINGGGVTITSATGKSDTWVTVSSEFISTASSAIIVYALSGGSANFTGNGADVIYLKNVTVTPIGALVDLDMATGGGTTLTDRSANRLDATLYGAYTHTIPRRELFIEGGVSTTNNPSLSIAQSWNNGAVTFDGISYTLTDTASAAASRFANFLVGTSRKLTIGKDGSLTTWGSYTDTSNYRQLLYSQTSGGAATIQSQGLGTGLSGNTLAIGTNGVTALSLSSTGVSIPVNLSATQGDLPSSVRAAGGVVFGSTAGSRAESVMTGQAIGTGDYTLSFRFRMPTTNPTATEYPANLYESATDRALLSVDTAGNLYTQFQKTSESSIVTAHTSISVATRGGQFIDVTIVRTGVTNALVYVNGSLLSTGTITGPAVGASFSAAAKVYTGNLSSSSQALMQTLTASRLFNRALSAADVLALSLYGINAADEWATMVPLYTSDFSSGADGWVPGSSMTVTGNIDANADGAGVPPSNDWLRVAISVTRSIGIYQTGFTAGKRYKITANVFVPAGSPVTHCMAAGSGTYMSATGTTALVAGSVTAISNELIAGNSVSPSDIISIFCNGSSSLTALTQFTSGTAFYIKDIVITPIGALVDLDMATGGGTILTDRSSNRLDATLYGAYTHIIPSRQSVLESGTLTTSKPALNISQTWNDAGIGFEASSINITNTASAATSYFSTFRLGGASKFSVSKDGYVFAASGLATSYINFGNTGDTYLYKDAAGTIAQRNSTNAQTLLTYGTYIDASNYRRLRHTMTTGGASTIASEGLGTGLSGNTLVLSSNGVTAIDIGAAGVNIPVNLAATQGNLPSMARVAGGAIGGVQWSSQPNGRAESVLIGQAIGTNDFTLSVTFNVVSDGVSTHALATVYEDGNNCIYIYHNTSGDLFGYAVRKAGITSFITTKNPVLAQYNGQFVNLTLVRSAGTVMTSYLNGVQLTTMTNSNADSVFSDAATFKTGSNPIYVTPAQTSIVSSRLFNRALSASEVADLSLHGVDAGDEWGTMVPLYSSNFTAGTDGWTPTRVAITGNIDGIGTPSTDDVLQITEDSTAASTHVVVKTVNTVTGKRYKLTANVLIPTTNAAVIGVQFHTTGALIVYPNTPSANWQSVSGEFVANGTTLNIYTSTAIGATHDGNGTDTVYVKDIVVTPIGALIDLDMATGGGTTLTDRSSNRLDATLYGAYTHIIPRREVVIDSGTLTANNPALNLVQTWNNVGVTFEGAVINATATAAAGNSRLLVLKSAGADKFMAYSSGGFWTSADSTIVGYLGLGGSGDLFIRREANGQMTLRNGVNPQSFRVFGTYTDTSNYRSFDLTTTTGGATKLDSKGLGTGVSGNTLQLAVNGLAGLDIAADGDATFGYDLNAASGSVLTRVRTQAGTAPAVLPSSTATSRVDTALTRTAIGTGDFAIAVRFEVPTVIPAVFQTIAALYEDANNRISIQLINSSGELRFDARKGGVLIAQTIIANVVSTYGGQVIDLVASRVGTINTASINGVQVLSGSNANSDVSFTAAARLISGNWTTGTGNPYLSRIYNTQLYTRALSASDCADLAIKGINPADQWVDGSALYTSDFSAGVNGWSVTRATSAGNIDGIGGQDDTLRLTVDATASATHIGYKSAVTTIGKRNRFTGSVFIPSSNATVNGVSIIDGGITLATITTLDTWVSFSAESVSSNGILYAYMASGGSFTFNGNGTDVIYLKNITVTPIGCALSWRYVGPGPTFADDSSNAYLGLGVGVSQTLPSSGGTYSYEARFLASAISTSAGTTKLIDLSANTGIIDIEVVRHAAMDGGITLDVGTSGTAAKYVSALAMSSTGLIYADSLSKGSESTTAITPIYIKKSGSTTVGDISVRITIRARH